MYAIFERDRGRERGPSTFPPEFFTDYLHLMSFER